MDPANLGETTPTKAINGSLRETSYLRVVCACFLGWRMTRDRTPSASVGPLEASFSCPAIVLKCGHLREGRHAGCAPRPPVPQTGEVLL